MIILAPYLLLKWIITENFVKNRQLYKINFLDFKFYIKIIYIEKTKTYFKI